jgi:DNA ligase (NAD+)
MYKNSRNMAAGSIRLYDAEICAKRGLVFSPFGVIEGFDDIETKSERLDMLAGFGFLPCQYSLPCINVSEEMLSTIISDLRRDAENANLPIDGIVATYNDVAYSQSCGRTGHHYKDGIAYKFEDDLYETVLQAIEWQPSRYGELSPVAIFNPVEIDGCEVSRASLHNPVFITDLELMPNCRILVSKRNMIIPHVEENLDRGNFNAKSIFPKTCPCCGNPTQMLSGASDTLNCTNPNCAARRLRQFSHFVSKKAMDIDGLSESALEKFIKRDWLHDFTDIYKLDKRENEVKNLAGFGEKSWTRLWPAIQNSRNTTFEKFLVAVDIPEIGRTASRELGKLFNDSLDAFETAIRDNFDFTSIDGFGETLHNNIHNWFKIPENITLWKELQNMVTIENKNAASESAKIPESSNNPFAGKTIVVTGTLSHFTRNSINVKLESLGAKVSNTVSKKTDFLITGEKAGSKLDKARTLGVKTLSEQEFLSML